MFNYLFQEQHWCESRTFKISAPYKNLTKTELIKLFLEKGGDSQMLLDSYSCYNGTDPCGWCKPCFRKWVALKNNNINTNNYFNNKPYNAPWLNEVLKEIESPNGYRGREDKEILNALNKNEN